MAQTRRFEETAQFAADVQLFISRQPRQLPSRYFYDALGSALFEAICHLPWYRITRAESRLLAAHAQDVFRRLAPLSTIVELGPGGGEKLKLLLDGALQGAEPLDVHLVDVSNRALETAGHRLATIDGVRVVSHATEYSDGLQKAAASVAGGGRTLVLFLGSNIGNFDTACAAASLESIRANLRGGDALLLGTDLVKPEPELVLAYDDPLGVTAAFNRNLLARINAELGGDFDVAQFAHRAVWNPVESRMEMYLVAQEAQDVRIPASNLAFRLSAGEPIWTESSYKYRPETVNAMLDAARFRTDVQWIDATDAFALTLAQAI
jgi:L-histidine Nalpha-methyltransferase